MLEWDYNLNGHAISFAKWGRLKKDQSWDKSYITRGKDDSVASVLPMLVSKVQWAANATMVIMNASLSDAGYYGCSIDLDDGRHMISSTELEVLRECILNMQQYLTILGSFSYYIRTKIAKIRAPSPIVSTCTLAMAPLIAYVVLHI